MSNFSGKLIIVSAPSGSGKTTLVKSLLDKISNISFSISCTTRSPRINEKNNKDYYFLSAENFIQKKNNGEFVESEEVYPGIFYGTLKSEISRLWKEEKHIIFDIDVIGGLNIKRQFTDKALSVFIKVPSIEIIENRLKSRNTDSEKTIETRLAKVREEMKYEREFDYVLLNDNLEEAKDQFEKKVLAFIQS